MNMKKYFLNAAKMVFALTFLLYFCMVSCKKSKVQAGNDDKTIVPSTQPEEGPSKETDTRKVQFKIGSFSSVIADFKPTAEAAMDLLSKVLSSKEFKDSIYKYHYAPSNQMKSPSQCAKAKELNLIKVNPLTGRVDGSMVYEDLLKYKDVALNLTIRQPSEPTNVLGSSSYCSYTITSNSHWLVDNMAMTLPEEYAIHLGHEFCHVVGYYHGDHPDTKTEDVSYGIGSLIANILWDWSLKEIKKKELHSYLLDNSNWRLRCLAVQPADMPQSGKFNDILQLDLANAKSANRSYNHFYFDFNPPEEQRKSGSNVVFGVTTASGSYWVEHNYYRMDWLDRNAGTFKFTYIANNGSSSATLNYSKNLRALFERKTFKMIYSNQKGPSGRVMANFISVEDPEIFFYGRFERKWINWF
jgi:hypothetical protein